VGSDRLDLPGLDLQRPGAGTVGRLASLQRLTAPDAVQVTDWRLPVAFMPGPGQQPLSYHHNLARWRMGDSPDYCRLKSVARGQEFVLDLDDYPPVMDWLISSGLFVSPDEPV